MFLCLTDYYIAKETILTTFGYFASRARQVYIVPIAKANTVVYIYFTRIPISKDSTIGPMELLALLIPG